MNTIICLTTDIDEKDLSYFEEALEGESYDVFLTDKYGLKNALKENKSSDEIIVLCENDIDFVLRTVNKLNESKISVFNTRSHRFLETDNAAAQQATVNQNATQAAQSNQANNQQTATQPTQPLKQVVLIESCFNLATKTSKINADIIKNFMKSNANKFYFRFIHNPVIPNVQRLSSAAEVAIASKIYDLKFEYICDVIDSPKNIIAENEDIVGIIATDETIKKVNSLIKKPIQVLAQLNNHEYEDMKKLISIVQEIEKDFKNKKQLVNFEGKDAEKVDSKTKEASIEECKNENVILYFGLLAESLKRERQIATDVATAKNRTKSEMPNIEGILKTTSEVIGLDYGINAIMGVLNDPESPLSGLIGAASNVYNKMKKNLKGDSAKKVEKLKSKIESINSTSLKDIKAYFKIHPKWKTFEQIAGL